MRVAAKTRPDTGLPKSRVGGQGQRYNTILEQAQDDNSRVPLDMTNKRGKTMLRMLKSAKKS